MSARRLPAAALLVVLGSACVLDTAPYQPGAAPGQEGPGRAARPIVDGALDPGDPAVVAIGSRRVGCDERLAARCTGTLVAPRLVLTAAHCVIDRRLATDLEVMVGSDVGDPEASFHRVVDVAVHPEYTADGDPADVAVLVLDAPAAAEPIALPSRPLDGSLVGREVRIVGFGETGPTGQPPGSKRTGTATVSELTETWLRIEPGPSMSCHGDSGGPVLGEQDGVEVLLGVASRGDPGCAVYGINARADRFARELIEPWSALPPEPMEDGAVIPGGEMCTAACTRDAECPDGTVCRSSLDGNNRCVIPGLAAGNLGDICNADDTCNTQCVRLLPNHEAGACRCYRACSEVPGPGPGSGADGGCALSPGRPGRSAGRGRDRLWMIIVLVTLVLYLNRNQENTYS